MDGEGEGEGEEEQGRHLSLSGMGDLICVGVAAWKRKSSRGC